MLSPEDRWEIQDLLARYNWAIDTGDEAAWLDTFTDDGVFESPIVGTHRGKQELAECHRQIWSREDWLQYTGGQHRVSNVLIEEDSSSGVSMRSNFILVIPGERGGTITVTGDYHDTLIRTENGWRFSRREVRPVPY